MMISVRMMWLGEMQLIHGDILSSYLMIDCAQHLLLVSMLKMIMCTLKYPIVNLSMINVAIYMYD